MRECVTHCARRGCAEARLFDGTLDAVYKAIDHSTSKITIRLEPQMPASAQVEAALARLTNEDTKLGERLINAAVAGAVVARQPADTMLRAEAAEAWNSIKAVIASHLSSEEDIVLPWMKSQQNFPPDLILRTCEQHTRLARAGANRRCGVVHHRIQ